MPHPSDPEARLAAIVASPDDAIVGKDLEGFITSWNVAAERIFGYLAREAVGRHIHVLIPDDRRAEEAYVLGQVRAGLKVDPYETVRRRKDGTVIEVSITVSLVRDVEGEITGVSAIVRDLTRARRLEREAFRLAAIVASSDDAILSKDLDGIIQTWNRGAERIFGYTEEEAIGKSITIVIPQERIGEEAEVLSRIRAGLSVDHFETVRKHKDGRLIDISLTVSPILTPDGVVIGASKIARDITEARRLRTMADEASRMKDEFLAVLSHELRTPLNTVLGYARMLRSDDQAMTDELRRRALDALERNAALLTRLVNDVLDTSRIVTGKLRLALEECPVDPLIEAAVETIRPQAAAKGVAVDIQLETNLSVLADRDRLQQVLWNLLSNAIKFTPSGGVVTVRARRHDRTVAISVEDTGIGIAAEHLPLLFLRFWQAHTGTSREFAGLGIGLALARHLVELHGGTIAAESAGLGRGSIFTVGLPDPSSLPPARAAFGPPG